MAKIREILEVHFKPRIPKPEHKSSTEWVLHQEYLFSALLIWTTVHKTPRGYPKLATFLDSDDRFMVYRRFGYLQSRLLLEKQDDLRILEARLDRLDKSEFKNDDKSLMTREIIEDDQPKPQAKVLNEFEEKFQEYCGFIHSQVMLNKCSTPFDISHSRAFDFSASSHRPWKTIPGGIFKCGIVDPQCETLPRR